MVERLLCKQDVRSSNLLGSTISPNAGSLRMPAFCVTATRSPVCANGCHPRSEVREDAVGDVHDRPICVVCLGDGAREQALAVVMEVMVNTGRLDWPTVVARMSTTPAAIGQVAGQGRPIAVGEPANLVLVDPSARAVVDRDASTSRSRNNPYHGLDLPDPVVATVWAGRITYRR